jgi:phage antirepressor YoqD-like protein
MNDITATNASPIVSINAGQPVTTSLAIAEGVGNPHSTVIKLIRQNVSDLEDFGGVRFEIQPFETAGGIQNREVAILNEQQSTLLLTYMRNNDVVRAFKKRLVKEFFALREQSAKPDPIQTLNDPAAMRGLLLSYSEKVLEQERALQEAAPKVEFANRVEIAHDAITVGEAAKIIGTGRTRLFAFLRRHGWVNRRNEPYQPKIEAGLMDVKISHWEHPEQGLKENITALVTGKGLVRLQKLWDQESGVAA